MPRFMRSPRFVVPSLLAALLVLSPAVLASTFEVSVPGNGNQIFGSPVPVGIISDDQLGHSGALAANGRVGVATFVGVPATNALTGGSGTHDVTAFESVDDLIFTGPAALVPFHEFFHYDGSIGFSLNALGDNVGDVFQATTAVTVQLNTSVTCPGCGAQEYFGQTSIELDDPSSSGHPDFTGTETHPSVSLDENFALPISSNFIGQSFAGVDHIVQFSMFGVFDTGALLLPTNVPVSISFRIHASDSVFAQAIAGGNAYVDFGHTFGFPVGVPVFDLPAGFTANAPSIGLHDNVIGPPIAAPEPATLPLLAAALSAVAAIRLRRRGR